MWLPLRLERSEQRIAGDIQHPPADLAMIGIGRERSSLPRGNAPGVREATKEYKGSYEVRSAE